MSDLLLEELPDVGKIMFATSYEEAKKIQSIKQPDLVLMDIHLPGMSGIELLKRIKASKWTCRVIIVSNQANEYYRQFYLKNGADYFFDKTNDFLMIPEIVRLMKNP